MKAKFVFLILLMATPFHGSHAQSHNSGIDKKLMNHFDSRRIMETHYKLFAYGLNEDTLFSSTIMDREIIKDVYNSTDCYKIVETYYDQKGRRKVFSYIDANTLLPVYFETRENGIIAGKYLFTDDKIIVEKRKEGQTEKYQLPKPKGVFLSHAFSELIQANDFGQIKKITFKTFAPEKPINTFIAERRGDEMINVENQKIDCWRLKFSRINDKGQRMPAGYRLVEKTTGKVLAFHYEGADDTLFGYQILNFKL